MARFSFTVSEGKTRRPWGTRPIPSLMILYESIRVMSWPLKRIAPLLAGVNPTMDRISVVFPTPFRPRRATTVPFATSRLTPWRT